MRIEVKERVHKHVVTTPHCRTACSVRSVVTQSVASDLVSQMTKVKQYI